MCVSTPNETKASATRWVFITVSSHWSTHIGIVHMFVCLSVSLYMPILTSVTAYLLNQSTDTCILNPFRGDDSCTSTTKRKKRKKRKTHPRELSSPLWPHFLLREGSLRRHPTSVIDQDIQARVCRYELTSKRLDLQVNTTEAETRRTATNLYAFEEDWPQC